MSKHFITELYPIVTKNLSDPKKSKEMQSYIDSYVDKHTDVLFDKGITNRLYFNELDRFVVYKNTGLLPNDIKEFIRKHNLTDSAWRILNDPFNWCSVLAIRHYMLNKKDKELQKSLMFLSLSLYASLHSKYFQYIPNENIMDYTVNHLSNKYYLKQHGSFFKALSIIAMNSHENYEDALKKGDDIYFKDYIAGLRTRINSFVQGIANQYYDAREKGLYLNKEKDSQDEESFFEVDNVSAQIGRLAQSSALNIISTRVDRKRASVAAKQSQISEKALQQAIEELVKLKDADISELTGLILQLYLIEGKNQIESIASTKFISYCLLTYSKSNTVDPTVLRIKEILDEWLELTSEKYAKTERIATKGNFRKALYIYVCLMIQKTYVEK